MPSGAHTPVMFAKGGGNAMFSQNCVSLLSEVGFSPDDFGSHNALSERQAVLRKRAKRVSALSRENRERHGGPLTEAAQSRHDRAQQQTNVEIGHLGQNAAKQRQRGNPCSNLVDGQDTGEYPCVRIGGPAFGRGGVIDPSTEHGHQSANEVSQARSNGRTADTSQQGVARKDGRPPESNSVYPANQMAADERARCSDLCKERAAQPGTTNAQDAGAMPATPSAAQQKSLDDYDKALNDRDADTAGTPTEIDGETAAECIDTFHKMGVAAMNKKMEESVADNERKAGTPEQRRQAREAADAAEARAATQGAAAQQARDERSSANRQAGQLNSESNPRSDPAHPKHEQWQNDCATSRDRVAAAETACANSEGDHGTSAQEASNLRRQSSTMDNAHCRAEQGRRLASGEGRSDGRVPGGRPPPAVDDNSQGGGLDEE